ncbi:protein kinase [Streptomyces sp. NPDC093224]|uniref:serine/threonine-protein kinase n=1 Tax=Streptomyces sp. NPDC093224 TaxID=3155198 RepID=UPI003421F27B
MAGTDVFPAGLARRYRPLDVLGRGGMGVVFEAEDTRLRRRVAVKVLSSSGPGLSREMQRRFVAEAIALARISHPGVVVIHDSGVDTGSGTPFLVMELLEGEDLAVLGAGRPLPTPAACRIAVDMLEALEEAHRSGVLHRDVKPGNVRVRADGRVVLYDFGLALVTEEPRITTAAGHRLLGTAQYMAPERIRGLAPSGATDLYGVGACLHFMLTGSPPFGDVPVDLGVLVLRAADGLPSLRDARPPFPRALVEVLDALGAAEQQDRPAAAGQAADLLRPWARGGEEQIAELVGRHLARRTLGSPRPAPRDRPPEASGPVFLDAAAHVAWHAVDTTTGDPVLEPAPAPVRLPGPDREPLTRPVPVPEPRIPAEEDAAEEQDAEDDAAEDLPEADARPAPTSPDQAQEGPQQPTLSEVTRRLVHSRMTERTALSRQREAVGLILRGDIHAAAQLLDGVTPLCHESLGAGHPTTLACQYWQAVCMARLGEAAKALELFARVSAHHADGRDGTDD